MMTNEELFKISVYMIYLYDELWIDRKTRKKHWPFQEDSKLSLPTQYDYEPRLNRFNVRNRTQEKTIEQTLIELLKFVAEKIHYHLVLFQLNPSCG